MASNPKQALSGIRVIDMSRLLPGPMASQFLADLGAEVIKVEDSDGGDYARYYPPSLPDGNSSLFHALNRGKKSVLLNLKKNEDCAQLNALLATADILLETFRPGVMAKLGFSPAELQQRFGKLIICSITGYGQTGPAAMRAGHDLNYLARAGVLGMMKTPTVLPVQVADIAGGTYPAVIQILAALLHRQQTGKGCWIDVSMTDWALAMTVMAQSKFLTDGEPIGGGRDLLCGQVPCYDIYRSKDGHLAVAALEPKFWKALCKALQLPELANSSMATGSEGEAVRSKLQQVLITKTTQEWERFFAPLDVMVEPVRQPENILQTEPQFASGSRPVSVTVEIEGKKFVLPALPIVMTGTASSPQTKCGPLIGEHNAQILPQNGNALKAKL